MTVEDDRPSERRTSERASLTLKVEYPSREGFLLDYTENISHGGMMIRAAQPAAVGEQVELALSFPGLLTRVVLRGTVRWVDQRDDDYAIGVAFAADNDATQTARVMDLVDRIARGDSAVVTDRVLRVLVAEDNTHLAALIQRGLEGRGRSLTEGLAFSVDHVADGVAAWACLQQSPPDLLVAEANLPGLDGIEVVARARQQARFAHLPIIAICRDAGMREPALRAGADFFLPKPIKLVDLLETLRILLVVDEVD
ncbi:MAG: TIGR02266 family protein [Deltaproteobacteria bacterium]|nr:TIGR02266 family protein [Deltaproteobacteria bacterium]